MFEQNEIIKDIIKLICSFVQNLFQATFQFKMLIQSSFSPLSSVTLSDFDFQMTEIKLKWSTMKLFEIQ